MRLPVMYPGTSVVQVWPQQTDSPCRSRHAGDCRPSNRGGRQEPDDVYTNQFSRLLSRPDLINTSRIFAASSGGGTRAR